MIFVFGSNEAGVHGSGAARDALLKHGAGFGIGFGPCGDSFAIPTKDWNIKTLPTHVIDQYISRFIAYANFRPDLRFMVTQIGCGLAGYTPELIAPMFMCAPDNCFFDEAWKTYLGDRKKYWGTK